MLVHPSLLVSRSSRPPSDPAHGAEERKVGVCGGQCGTESQQDAGRAGARSIDRRSNCSPGKARCPRQFMACHDRRGRPQPSRLQRRAPGGGSSPPGRRRGRAPGGSGAPDGGRRSRERLVGPVAKVVVEHRARLWGGGPGGEPLLALRITAVGDLVEGVADPCRAVGEVEATDLDLFDSPGKGGRSAPAWRWRGWRPPSRYRPAPSRQHRARATRLDAQEGFRAAGCVDASPTPAH